MLESSKRCITPGECIFLNFLILSIFLIQNKLQQRFKGTIGRKMLINIMTVAVDACLCLRVCACVRVCVHVCVCVCVCVFVCVCLYPSTVNGSFVCNDTWEKPEYTDQRYCVLSVILGASTKFLHFRF